MLSLLCFYCINDTYFYFFQGFDNAVTIIEVLQVDFQHSLPLRTYPTLGIPFALIVFLVAALLQERSDGVLNVC